MKLKDFLKLFEGMGAELPVWSLWVARIVLTSLLVLLLSSPLWVALLVTKL